MAKKRGKPDSFRVDTVTISPVDGPFPGDLWTWRARWTDAAGRHERGLGRTDHAGALAAWLEALRSGCTKVSRGAGPIVTIDDLVRWWLAWQDDRLKAGEIRASTHRAIEAAAGLIGGHLGDVRVRVFGLPHVYDFVTRLRASGRSPLYAREVAYKLVGAWNQAITRGLIDGRHIEAKIKRQPKTPQTAQTDAEIRRVLAMLSGRMQTYARLLAVTGMRPAEAGIMHASDLVDERHGRRTITVYRLRDADGAKSGARAIPIPADVAAELRALAPLTADGALFSRHQGGLLNCALKRRGVRWRAYALRKSKTEAMYGVTDPRTEAEALGHDPAIAVRSYMTTTIAKIADAFAASRPDRERAGKVVEIGGHEWGLTPEDIDED